ncbi:MAG: glycosyltransferase [Polyangiaceae bacterium]|nr:glycosyltransferase [Polyangiaceae bacterium]
MEILFVCVYLVVLLALCTYGLHRAYLAVMCWRTRRFVERIAEIRPTPEADLPRVTVQLPLYNEATVVERLIEATGKLDYPAHLFEIQVLDDSSDETCALAKAAVERLVQRGVDAKYVRRADRVGYKAGALDFGLKTAKGELIAIFDADFVPQPSFLRTLVAHFRNPKVAVVQTRWAHMNRDHSLLTSIQALMLDGHHLIENRSRFSAGLMFNFSGTGGIWRKEAIADAGGWQHDTLTEDLDLSYRAQLRGWQFIYRPDVLTPSELPEELSALRAQQYRWAKGTVQTARKLLGTVLRSKVSTKQKVEACFHMLPHFAYPLMLLLTVLLLPSLVYLPAVDLQTMLIVDLPFCIGATGSLIAFYCLAEVSQGRSAWAALVRLPALIALGAGLSPHLTGAVLGGVRSMAGEFVRTPKRGSNAARYREGVKWPFVEAFFSVYCMVSVVVSVATSHWFATPFAFLFSLGYGYVAVQLSLELAEGRRSVRAKVSAPAARGALEPGVDMARAA